MIFIFLIFYRIILGDIIVYIVIKKSICEQVY